MLSVVGENAGVKIRKEPLWKAVQAMDFCTMPAGKQNTGGMKIMMLKKTLEGIDMFSGFRHKRKERETGGNP